MTANIIYTIILVRPGIISYYITIIFYHLSLPPNRLFLTNTSLRIPRSTILCFNGYTHTYLSFIFFKRNIFSNFSISHYNTSPVKLFVYSFAYHTCQTSLITKYTIIYSPFTSPEILLESSSMIFLRLVWNSILRF